LASFNPNFIVLTRAK